jgi:hypothetical protein
MRAQTRPDGPAGHVIPAKTPDPPDQRIERIRRRRVLDDSLVDPRLDVRDHTHLEGGRVAVDCPGQVLQLEFGSGDPHRGPDIDCGGLLT